MLTLREIFLPEEDLKTLEGEDFPPEVLKAIQEFEAKIEPYLLSRQIENGDVRSAFESMFRRLSNTRRRKTLASRSPKKAADAAANRKLGALKAKWRKIETKYVQEFIKWERENFKTTKKPIDNPDWEFHSKETTHSRNPGPWDPVKPEDEAYAPEYADPGTTYTYVKKKMSTPPRPPIPTDFPEFKGIDYLELPGSGLVSRNDLPNFLMRKKWPKIYKDYEKYSNKVSAMYDRRR